MFPMDAYLYLSGPLRLARVADLTPDLTDRDEAPTETTTEPGHVRLRVTTSLRVGTRPASWPSQERSTSASA